MLLEDTVAMVTTIGWVSIASSSRLVFLWQPNLQRVHHLFWMVVSPGVKIKSDKYSVCNQKNFSRRKSL